jgi:hypothetical protein
MVYFSVTFATSRWTISFAVANSVMKKAIPTKKIAAVMRKNAGKLSAVLSRGASTGEMRM